MNSNPTRVHPSLSLRPTPERGRQHPARAFLQGSPKALLALAIAAFVVATVARLVACGPYFPNSLIENGDGSVLQAPTVSLVRELQRLKLEPPAGLVHHAASQESLHDATLDAEITDLRRALAQRGVNATDQAPLVLEFSGRRADLASLRLAHEESAPSDSKDGDPDPAAPPVAPVSPPARTPIPWVAMSEGIPREFDLYLEAAAAWYARETNRARSGWEAVLALPIDQRGYKSTWAAFMLGRSWHDEDPITAERWYRRTREFSRSGLMDSASLAVASLGWEAQLRVRADDLPGAMRLYLDQFAAGSTQSSPQSLALCAERVSNSDPEQLETIARDRTLRRVVTAWFLAYASWDHLLPSERPKSSHPTPTERWLDALEAVHAGEIPLAEQLALLAYRSGDWATARRWTELAPDSLVARWVSAKLLLRDGQVPEAAQELALVIARLPLEPDPLPRGQAPDFADSLSSGSDDAETRFQVRGELALLKLARGDFEQALDLFLRARFWRDAAYLAERVLTTDELKAYVDRAWPAAPPRSRDAAPDVLAESRPVEIAASHPDAPDVRRNLRDLLGRRLNRDQRGPEALAYLAPERHDRQVRLLSALATFRDTTLAPAVRATAGAAAAWMTRTNGLELFGTELAPDFALYEGSFDLGEIYPGRASTNHPLTRATRSELHRAHNHAPVPYARFHYRYQAAQLAWDAAKLMPDQDPVTAQLLYDAGCWLKARDPMTADLFYKALVNRCGRTPLGAAADRQRWFPPLDDQGNPYVTRIERLPGPLDFPIQSVPAAAEKISWSEDDVDAPEVDLDAPINAEEALRSPEENVGTGEADYDPEVEE